MRDSGFSLLELLFALLLLAALLAIGTPGLRALALDARRTADINAFVTAIHLARSEAAMRSASIVICRSASGFACETPDERLETGWIVFVDADDNGARSPAGNEPVLFSYRPSTVGTIRSNRRRYAFRRHQRRSTNGTITFCDERGPPAARAIIVSYTGRPRVSAHGPGNRPLQCAAS